MQSEWAKGSPKSRLETKMAFSQSNTVSGTQATHRQQNSQERDDDGDSSEEHIEIPKKLKADTDHQNLAFTQSLKQRTMA